MRFLKALIISLLVYALFIWLYITYFSKIEKPSPKLNNHVIKIDIRDIPLPPKPIAPIKKAEPKKESVPKKIIKKQPIVKQEPIVNKKPKKKKVVKKKVVKKKIVKKKVLKKKVIKKKIVKKKPVKKKIVKKKVVKKEIPKKKIIVKKKAIKKKPIEKEVIFIEEPIIEEEIYTFEPIIEEKSQELQDFENEMVYIAEPMIQPKKAPIQTQSDDLSSFLSVPEPAVSPWSYPNNKIRKMYGASFHQFTDTQKKFIENNLDSIQQITQRTLTQRGYPEGAGRTGQQGTNVVSFNLHPNGNISDLRLKTRIGYRALDDNTLSLIRVAYMDYPYPSTTTKIIFYVTYSIYGY